MYCDCKYLSKLLAFCSDNLTNAEPDKEPEFLLAEDRNRFKK